jgi:hypothetical protein
MSETRPKLSGKSQASPERGLERDGEMWAACPVCWPEDRVTDIQREASEYHADKVIRKVSSGLIGGSMTVKPTRKFISLRRMVLVTSSLDAVLKGIQTRCTFWL